MEQPDTSKIEFPEKELKPWTTLVDNGIINILAYNDECEPEEMASALVTSIQVNT